MKTKINKSFRHKSGTYKNKKIGAHSHLLNSILTGDVHSFRRNFKPSAPKPCNVAEVSMLAKFIFGIELTFRFDQFYNYNDKLANTTDVNFSRFFKLFKLDPNKPDFIQKKSIPKYSGLRIRDGKVVLINLRYVCNQKHDDYYDYKMSQELFDSCYELDGAFWRHCIGELYCGGIGSSSYGQVEFTSFKEYDRILNMHDNPDQPVSDSFKKKIDKLIKEDKKYDNEKSLEM